MSEMLKIDAFVVDLINYSGSVYKTSIVLSAALGTVLSFNRLSKQMVKFRELKKKRDGITHEFLLDDSPTSVLEFGGYMGMATFYGMGGMIAGAIGSASFPISAPAVILYKRWAKKKEEK